MNMNQNNYSNNPEMDYYMNEDLCDVEFEVNGQRIPAPKQLLSVKSLVFRAMFSGNFKESEDKVIPIEDTTVEAFKTFIRFVICEQLVFSDDNDFELFGQVFRLSDKYQFQRLSDKVLDFIKRRVNVQNLRSITRIAFNYNMEPLMTIVIKFIERNINEIIHLDIEELSEINDCTNNRLLDVLISNRVRNDNRLSCLECGRKRIYMPKAVFEKVGYHLGYKYFGYSRNPNIAIKPLKVLIGFLYFNRLIIEDKNDIKFIREVMESTFVYSHGLYETIEADLQNRITIENMKPILKLMIDLKIKSLSKKVFEFIEPNIEELIKRNVEELKPKPKSGLKLIRNICKAINLFKITTDLKERMAVLLKDFITFDNLFIFYKLAVDYNIEDLITNIKTFIEQNFKQLKGKDMTELIEMNTALDNTLFEVMAKYSLNN